jgi:hypothetical protein
MTNCKPCITIRQIARIIYINLKDCYKNIRTDIKSYSRINATVCHLDTGNYGPIPDHSVIAAIKKEAQERYNPVEAQALLKEAHDVIQADRNSVPSPKEAHR